MFFRSILLLAFLTTAVQATAQWDSYEATWEGFPGLMLVQMDLYDHAPYQELPYLVVITQATLDCNDQGYPSEDFVGDSELLLEEVDSALSERQYIEDAGRLIYQCSVRDYLYVQDTLEVVNWLKNNLMGMVTYEFREDHEWKVYKDFIYPDDFLMQTMINGRILKTLEQQNIFIKDKKELAHFASFPTSEDLHDYRRFLIGLNYKIREITESEGAELPHLITFSRKDRLALDKLSNTTLRLHQRAESLDGSYDGWEIEVGSK